MQRVRFKFGGPDAGKPAGGESAGGGSALVRAVAVGFLAIGTLLMTACGDADETVDEQAGLTGGWRTAGCEFSVAPQTVTIGGVTMPATPPELDAVIARIDRAGRGDFAGSYAGVEVDEQQVRAVVYRVPSAAFDDFIRRQADNACVIVRDAAHSTSELAVWHDRVLADIPFWTSRGIRIVTIGARHDGVGVEVGTRDLDRARMELPARYGGRAPLILLAEGPVSPLATTAPPGG
jgi:hypothetical protein